MGAGGGARDKGCSGERLDKGKLNLCLMTGDAQQRRLSRICA